MPNQIVTLQNEPVSIAQLAAQRALYSSAKRLFAVQLLLGVPGVIFISLIALAFDKQWFGVNKIDLAWFVGLSGVAFLLLDVVVWTPIINFRREKAARIQQMFDCYVLQLPWNDVIYGTRPDQEEIVRWARKYSKDYVTHPKLKDWYRVEVAAPKILTARLICQRENCWWDMELRRKYNLVVYWIAALLMVAVAIIALYLDVTMTNFFSLFVAPLLPFLTLAPKLVQDNRDAISRLNVMKDAISGAWTSILQSRVSEAEISEMSLVLQHGIFNNRKANPLVFDFLHFLTRNDNENIQRQSVAHYVAELQSVRPDLM